MSVPFGTSGQDQWHGTFDDHRAVAAELGGPPPLRC